MHKLKKQAHIFLPAVMALLSWWLAFFIRFEGAIPREMHVQFNAGLIVTVLSRVFAYYVFGLNRQIWRYSGMRDLLKLCYSTALGTAMLPVGIMFLAHGYAFSRSVLAIDFLLSLSFLCGMRFGIRILREKKLSRKKSGRAVLVVGAGDAGEMIVREMLQKPERGYMPVAFADDDITKQGQLIHEVPVLGTTANIPEIVERKSIEEIVIAIPSASRNVLRKIFEYCRNSSAGVKALPSIADIIADRVTINRIRKVGVEDLLGREPVNVNLEEISGYISGKHILITGAGGSIGSELSRQVVEYSPSKLILLDHDENAMFAISQELLLKNYDVHIVSLVMDILNNPAIERVFSFYKPEVIFHAAAHKHVPLMEEQVLEAVRNNVLGTKNMVEFSQKYGVHRFVNISTDKAVEPVNVMGMTKRVGELIVNSYNDKYDAAFVSVRFGNVLGSSGSVIPIFKEQIEQGGPVIVTHPDMERYFMTVQEAVQLVVQTGAIADEGGIFVLDMGKPVNISRVAKELIELSGFTPDEDIDIVFSKPRPGEKLTEKLYWEGIEHTSATNHPKVICVENNSAGSYKEVLGRITVLLSAVTEQNEDEAIRMLCELASYSGAGF